MVIAYNSVIEEDAVRYGYKSANLMNLQDLVREFGASADGQGLRELYKIEINVPEFAALEGDIISKHLDKYAPRWRDDFKKFVDNFNGQANKNNLSKEAISAIEQLQKTIQDCCKEHPLSVDQLAKFLADANLKESDLLMIRSTGIHEDKADLANPGGNESVPCKARVEDISKAIGFVAASYVGAKSLSQRLIAGDTNITEFPVMLVLVQKMVGVSREAVVTSGVVYSGDGGGTRIQSAYGHGEYVVNSKGFVDNYYISNQDIMYRETRPKEFRLSPVFDELSGRIKLEQVENIGKLQYAPSLDEAQVLYLHEFVKFLEDKYQKRMDIEFVYDMGRHFINIVQARAIPEGSRKGLEPSALNPEFTAKHKEEIATIKVAGVITPEVNRAAVIIDKSQVIISQTIEQALSKYNELGKEAGIRGVIVQNPSPDTSHEAGVFNSSSISVMQVKDIEQVRELFNSAQPIIMDPQHSKIHQLPESLFNAASKSSEEIEGMLYEEQILAKGIYASTLSSFVTFIAHDLPQVDVITKGSAELKGESLGALLAKAKAGDLDSTKDLLAIAYRAIVFGQDQGSSLFGQDKAQVLHQNLELLSTPKIGEDNKDAKAGLGYILRALTDGHKKGIVPKDLFKQTVISGAEISILLEQLEKTNSQSLTKEKDKAYLQYFNSQKKFEGLITGEGESLATSLFNNKYAKIAEALAPAIEGESKAYLIESLKLSDYFLKDQSKENWQKFCANICKDENGAQRLGQLVNQAVTYNAHSKWVNVIFTDEYEKTNGDPEKTLAKLEQAFTETRLDDLQKAQKILKSMESQIPLWADPNKFEGLYKNLQENLKTINEKLAWNQDANNLQKILVLEQNAKLTDVMDKSIKSLERSSLYQDEMKDDKGNLLQVARMFDMVKDFHGVMMEGAKEVKFEQKDCRLKELKESIHNMEAKYLQGSLKKGEFGLSHDFAVNSATVNIVSMEVDQISKPKTLEDCFTAIHQNQTVIDAKLFADNLSPIIAKQYSTLVKAFKKVFDKPIYFYDSSPGTKGNKEVMPTSTIELIDNLRIRINIPLRGHAAIVEIKDNHNTQDLSINFFLFGKNENFRFEYIAQRNNLCMDLLDIKFITKSNFDKQKDIMNFEVQINNVSQIQQVTQEILNSIQTTFDISNHAEHKGLILSGLRENIRLLLSLLDKKNKNTQFSDEERTTLVPGLDITFQQFIDLPLEKGQFVLANLQQLQTLNLLYSIEDLYKQYKNSLSEFNKKAKECFPFTILARVLPKEYLRDCYNNKYSNIKLLMDYAWSLRRLEQIFPSKYLEELLKAKDIHPIIILSLSLSDSNSKMLLSTLLSKEFLEKMHKISLQNFSSLLNESQVLQDITKILQPKNILELYQDHFNNLKYLLENSRELSRLADYLSSPECFMKICKGKIENIEFCMIKDYKISGLIKDFKFAPEDITDLYKTSFEGFKYLIEESCYMQRLTKIFTPKAFKALVNINPVDAPPLPSSSGGGQGTWVDKTRNRSPSPTSPGPSK